MALLNGTTGDDILNGTIASDSINGLAGNDMINGGGGLDTLSGDDGDDTFIVSVPLTNGTTLDGGLGTDTLQLLSSGGTLINLVTGSRYAISLTAATLASLERVDFSSASGSGIIATVGWAQLGAGLSTTAELVGGAGFDQLSIALSTAGTYTVPNFALTN